MANSVWLIPALTTLFLYGIGQGLVKKWSSDVSPAQFCLFLILARSLVNIGYFIIYRSSEYPLTSPEGLSFLLVALLVYALDGIGWILYFESIVLGPITIVGTLSAAYPALTLLFARIFLKEQLLNIQYFGVFLVIFSCLGLSYSPEDENGKKIDRRWIPLALSALACWAAAQTLLRYSYSLPMASDANMAFYGTISGWCTLGLYGWYKGYYKRPKKSDGETSAPAPFFYSFLPMAMMAGGDLGVIIASVTGPASLVTPITGAYPLVTLIFAALILKEVITRFQWLCLVLLLGGIGLSTIPQAPEDAGAAEETSISAPASSENTPNTSDSPENAPSSEVSAPAQNQ